MREYVVQINGKVRHRFRAAAYPGGGFAGGSSIRA
ncbi:hypothetical protein FHX10_002161 [Rhizobium sp. BK591]|nr:hypothetical protein [Rhizobium sp. BK591]